MNIFFPHAEALNWQSWAFCTVLALAAEKAERIDIDDLVDEIDLKDCLLVKVLSLLKLLFLLKADCGREFAKFLEDAAYFIPPLGPIIFLEGSKLWYGSFRIDAGLRIVYLGSTFA